MSSSEPAHDGVYSRILEVESLLGDLNVFLCDPHPTEEQLRQAHELLTKMAITTDHPQAQDVHALLERLERSMGSVLRFRLRFDEKTRTILERSLRVLERLVEDRIANRPTSPPILRQCFESLDTLLVRAGWLKGVRGKKARRPSRR